MLRIAIALFAAPLLISSINGILGLAIVLPIMLLITGVLAVPLLLVLRKREWLKWEHAALAGLACSAVFAGLFALSSPGWADAYGLQIAILFGGYGVATALLFWWLGLFRNPAVPAVPRNIPYGMIALVPIAALAVPVHRSFDPTFFEGRIVSVTGNAPTRQTTVRLSSGSMVEVPFNDDDRPTSVLVNQCWHLSRHWSTVRMQKVYSLDSPYGAGIDDC